MNKPFMNRKTVEVLTSYLQENGYEHELHERTCREALAPIRALIRSGNASNVQEAVRFLSPSFFINADRKNWQNAE